MDNNSERNSQSRVMSYDEEESGWTAYFDEFFDDHQYSEEINSCFSASVESSLISDAASSSALVKKASAFHHHHHHHHHLHRHHDHDHDRNNKRSTTSSKRRKTEVADNGLEDTASSSVNSPKIYHLINQLGRKPAEAKDHAIDISKEKAGSISAQGDGRADSNINEEEEEESELKKRGLCLVPLSMLVKYI